MNSGNDATKPERYLTPKELSYSIEERYGLSVSRPSILLVRSMSKNDGLFVLGCARASDVFTWIQSHPEFSLRGKRRIRRRRQVTNDH